MVPIGATAGLVILGAITLLSIGWALWERRRQGRNVGNNGSGKASYGQVGGIPGVVSSSYENRHEMEARTAEAPTEIDGNIIAEM